MKYDLDIFFAKIEELRKKHELKEAYDLCLQILKEDPGNSKAVKLLEKIENDVKEISIRKVQENIKKIEPLWQQRKYEELVTKYQTLYNLVPTYMPLQELLAKAENKLREKIEEQKEKFISDFEKNLKKMFDEDKYEELILKSSQTRAAYPSNKKIAEIGITMRTKVVKAELEKNKPLLESHNYSNIIKFLEKLKKVEPTYKKTDKLLEEYRKKGLNNLNDSQNEFVYRGLSHTETLLQLKKYDQAIETASEILSVDPKNKEAQALLRKAKKKSEKQIQKEVIAKAKEYKMELDTEYAKNKTNFIRI